jgi:hypothetical protein
VNGEPERPAAVTVAAVLLMVFGSLIGLLGLLCVVAGAAIPALRQAPDVAEQLASVPEAFGMVAIVMGSILLTWGVTQVLAGVFVMRGRTWARIAGIVVGILGALTGLAGSLPASVDANPVGPIIFAVFGGVHVYAIWVLIRSAAWFASVERAPA